MSNTGPEVNSFDQPIGPPVNDWSPPPPPPRTPMAGRYCLVEALDPTRHGRDLYEANALDTTGKNWTYLPYGPFGGFNDYLGWLDYQSRSDDPLFQAVVDQDTGKAVGVASYLRINPEGGSIEVGHWA